MRWPGKRDVMGWAGLILFGVSLCGASDAREQRAELTVRPGTMVALAVTRAVWTKTVKAGDVLYAQTLFPVLAEAGMGIPAGSYVEGRIDAVTKPTRRKDRAQFHVRFTKIIFANGYVVELAGEASSPMVVTVQVSGASDILLDNGTQMEMVLGGPLVLDAQRVAEAVKMTGAVGAGQFRTASLCRPTAGTPGTSGTPGTVIPGSPGTPDVVIPGANGMPPTVIPGIPASHATVIPGTPGTMGTPGTYCPGPTIVVSSVAGKTGTRD